MTVMRLTMYKIYVVEDDSTITSLLKESLDRWGFESYCCTDFSTVLDEFLAIRPDLVLLDISLPYYNGFYWCDEIRKITKKNIIFVEDNNDLRELLAETLREYYNVEEVANGREALEQLANKNIDLVLTDIMMPGINGIELSKKIKENIDSSHIPVVILTAKTGDENQIEGLYSGADIYLKKPVNKQILLLKPIQSFQGNRQKRENIMPKLIFAQTDNTTPSIK